MTLIQPVLIILLFCALLAYQFWMRSKLAERAIVFGLGALGAVLISFPAVSTGLAHILGVGRGVDLVIYISLFGLGFVQLAIYSRVRAMEVQITHVVRELAIGNVNSSPSAQTGTEI